MFSINKKECVKIKLHTTHVKMESKDSVLHAFFSGAGFSKKEINSIIEENKKDKSKIPISKPEPDTYNVKTPECPYSFSFVGFCGDTLSLVVDSFIKTPHPNVYNEGFHFRNIPKFRISHNNSPPTYLMGHSGNNGVGCNELYNMISLIDARTITIKYNEIEQVFKCKDWIKANEKEDEENRDEDEDQEIFYDSSDFQRHFSDKINTMLSNWSYKF